MLMKTRGQRLSCVGACQQQQRTHGIDLKTSSRRREQRKHIVLGGHAASITTSNLLRLSRFGDEGRVGSLVVVSAGAAGSANATPCVMQFVKGVDESVVPEVKLTRSRDGSNGVATFIFMKPTIFNNDADIIQKGEITGLYMIDEEGTLQTTDVNASFLDGKPDRIEARYVMKSAFQWDRFMRFMERYANENGLGFNKA